MKRLWILFLAVLALLAFAGCDRVEDTIENKVDSIEETLEQKVNDAANALIPSDAAGSFTPVDPSQLISPEQAQNIALEHAGVPSDEAVGLHTVLQIDDGRQEYEVTFRVGHLEYEYEIDAATGKILSTDIDD